MQHVQPRCYKTLYPDYYPSEDTFFNMIKIWGNADFLTEFYSNFTYISYRYQYEMTSNWYEAAVVTYSDWKGETTLLSMFHWSVLVIFNSFQVIPFFILAVIYLLVAFPLKCLPKVIISKKHSFSLRTALRQTTSFEPFCVKISSRAWAGVATNEIKQKRNLAGL